MWVQRIKDTDMPVVSDVITSIPVEFFRKHPAILLVIIIACGSVVGYAHMTFAEDADVKQQMQNLETKVSGKIAELDTKVSDFKRDVFARFDEQRLYDLQREQDEIQRSIAAGSATARDHSRYSKLRSEIDSLKRNLNAAAAAANSSHHIGS